MDANRFRAAYIAKGYNQQTFATAMGLNNASLSLKMKHGRFTVNEMNRAAAILGLTRDETADIFMADADKENG